MENFIFFKEAVFGLFVLNILWFFANLYLSIALKNKRRKLNAPLSAEKKVVPEQNSSPAGKVSRVSSQKTLDEIDNVALLRSEVLPFDVNLAENVRVAHTENCSENLTTASCACEADDIPVVEAEVVSETKTEGETAEAVSETKYVHKV